MTRAREMDAKSKSRLVCRGALVILLAAAGCATEEPTYDLSPAGRYTAEDQFERRGDQPPSAKTLHSLARLLSGQGKDAEARFVLARTIREHDHFMPAYNELAELQMKDGHLEDAVKVLSLGLQMAPKDPVLLNNLGLCRLLEGKNDEALERFTAAAAGAPDDARYRANMAAALGMAGRYEEAIAVYEQVLPPDQAHYNLGVICETRGDTERSKIEFQRAEDLRLRAQQEALRNPGA